MSSALRKPMTVGEFLEWEDRQSLRYEFDGHQPVAMTGGTAGHARIQGNLAVSMISRLRGGKCSFFGSDLKIEVAGRIRYPDGFVVCTPVSADAKLVTDPVVIFEVLSDSTERTDLITKNHEYAATPSVRRYIVLAQDALEGLMYERVAGDWIGHLLTAESVLRMPELGIEVPLAELYQGIEIMAPGGATRS